MKKIIFSFLGALALLAAPVANADNLTEEQAREAAAHYLQHTSNLTRITADQLTLVYQRDNDELDVPAMFYFNAPKEGWIIMAATTVMHPVVSYSDEGSLNMNDLPPQMQVMLNQYHEMVCAVQNADAKADYPDCSMWKMLSGKQMTGNTKANDVVLMESKWDQGETAYMQQGNGWVIVGTTGNTYDMLTPKSRVNANYRCPVGCVATAIAQICYYYKYPTNQAKGFVFDSWTGGSDQLKLDTIVPFDYSKMVNTIPGPGMARSKRLEVSRLCYYVGLTVQMDYDYDGSSSNSYKVMNGFPEHFDYNVPTSVARSAIGTEGFINAIRTDLEAGRPVYMDADNSYEGGQGRDAAGHAFVCDGYTDDPNMFHFNWGWGGNYNNFFNLVGNTIEDMFISEQELSYTRNQGVLTKLYPLHPNTGISEVTGHATLGNPYPNPASYSISLPYQTEAAADLTIYNALGQQVQSHHVQAGEGTVKVRVDALPNGVYIYRLNDAYGKFVVK